MIEFYPSKLEGSPLERHRTDQVMTIEGWLFQNVPGYTPRQSPPISVELNGVFINPERWAKTEFSPQDTVRIYPEPKGTGLEVAVWAVVAAVVAVGVVMMTQRPLSTPRNQGRSGQNLNLAKTTGNQVKVGDVIREVAGRTRIFPDYLVPPRHYFVNETEQWVELLLCVGVGEFEINPTDVKIGDTTLASLGSTARYKVYGPGESLADESARLWWHNSTEVGATNTGSGGLTLTNTTQVAQQFSGNALLAADLVLSVPDGAGWFPFGWDSGMIARVELTYPYTFTAPVDGSATIVSGPHLPMLQAFVGMRIEIAGANAGNYIVASYEPEVPGTPPVPGNASMVTGSAAPARFNFDVVSLSFTVSRGVSSFPVSLNTNVANLAGLVSAVSASLSGTGLVASASSGRLRIAEQAAPFTGSPLSITGSVSDILGSSPAFVTGVKTEAATDGQYARMTMTYDGGAPAVGLQAGSLLATIGYRGLRYRITEVSDDSVEDDDNTPADESHGPSAITVVRLTDTGAVDDDWLGFDAMQTSDVSVVLDSSTTEGDWAGSFAVCPENEVVRRVELDFFFPAGLIAYSKKGRHVEVTVKVEAQYRDINTAGDWTSVFWTFKAARRDQIAFTRAINFPTYMRGEMRVRRIGEESSDSNQQDRVQWYGLRARIDKAPLRYEGVTTIAVYARGGTKLSAQSESQVSLIATRKLPVLVNGAWSEPTATRDIAPWASYVSKSVGATDDDVDIEEFVRYGAIWHSRGDYFDFSVEEAGTVKEALNDALKAGFAEFTLERGRITPVRDEPRSQIKFMYTPQNMTGSLKRSFTLPAPDDFDGVSIKYRDQRTWAEETVKCKLPGDAFKTVKEITLDGVTDRDRAWRYGMRQRRAQVYQNKSYSWSTELSALNSGYLSYDAVADDIPGYAQSGIMTGFTAGEGPVIIESSEAFVWSEGQAHVLAVRRPDGSISGPWVASRIDDYRIAIQSIDFVPDLSHQIEPPHLLFGISTRWCYPVLVTSIEPGDYSAEMEAINYDVRVYADDDNFAPEDA
ncbi:host specificity factor TipJ family phage tail protein [Pseudomonas sp. NPDC096925]|uniref:host specificity factor TipJ family phage tail protein n=1 Tax=Pseudomonas sp. NPDC096925 TaxID=3364484 RepID=UPI00383ACBBE